METSDLFASLLSCARQSDTLKKYRQAGEKMTETAFIFRAFDRFAPEELLPLSVFDIINEALATCLQDNSSAHRTTQLQAWTKNISNLGCDLLADSKRGRVKKEMIDLLKAPENTPGTLAGLVSAWTAHFCQESFLAYAKQHEDDPDVLEKITSAMQIVNRYYARPWTQDVLANRGFVAAAAALEREDPSLFVKFRALPLIDKMAIGVTVMGLFAVGSIMFSEVRSWLSGPTPR